MVVFPQIVQHLAVGRQRSLAALTVAAEQRRELIAVAQRISGVEDPGYEDLHRIGTIVRINRIEKHDSGAQVIVQGVRRVTLAEDARLPDYLAASFTELPEIEIDPGGVKPAAADAILRENLQLAQQIALLLDSENGAQIYQQLIGGIANPITQMYRIASLANLTIEQQQHVLDASDTMALLNALHEILRHELQVTELRRQIAEQARDDMEQQQREHMLRQQKRAIESALGEGDDDQDIAELKAQLDAAELPEPVRKEVDRELGRLKRMSANASDYQVARGYLELVAELPWHAHTDDRLELDHAQRVLDEDHYGLEDVKERILESLAVMQLNPDAKAPILCFVGPPGVGKTSLGQSIARAMGRKFERLSLGGLHDEAELRGHRRTYIGAMPGRILQAIRRTGVVNPILMLDEIDKLGRDFRGDPAAALMEILDPAQNREFRDNYLNLPYDLSRVLFITTANTLEGIPRPLLDRMEVLELSGYSDMEKQAIARQYLIPRQREEAGLGDAQLTITDQALAHMIRRYTREAGVRELERVIGRLARKRARQVVDAPRGSRGRAHRYRHLEPAARPGKIQVGPGPPDTGRRCCCGPRLDRSRRRRALRGSHTDPEGRENHAHRPPRPGDAGVRPGRTQPPVVCGRRTRAWIGRKSKAPACTSTYPPAPCRKTDRLPASPWRRRFIRPIPANRVPADLAMTGELTLSGLVLPVGGIKEKLLAAHRAGMRRIILPKDNAADLVKLPETVRAELDITLVETLGEVFAAAFAEN